MMTTTCTNYQSIDMCASRPRTAKHLTERKRRARINDSLLQLKSMVFPAVRKDISRHPKMEKADILEMTVRYLKDIQSPAAKANGETGVTDYHAGFTECLSEVSSFMSSCENIDIETRLRLLGHLADRCSTINDSEQKPDVSRLQAESQQINTPAPSPLATAVPTGSPSPLSYVPATSPNGGMVLLVPAHTIQPHQTVLTPASSPALSVQVPVSQDLLTPPQSPASPIPSEKNFIPAASKAISSYKMSQYTDLHSHRVSPYQSRPVKSANKSMWRPW
uniref:Hairy and enhancer of split transcription factor C n=1 Tax=Scaphechinus mirabilis TaxID=262334 RepID=E3WF07_SCAMI|nr:hairy and enhancer of split transcription factor C [Scaphechinus mirabilis]